MRSLDIKNLLFAFDKYSPVLGPMTCAANKWNDQN